MPFSVRIATRASPLALWQAQHIRAELERIHGPGLTVEVLALTTQGDRLLDRTLAAVGGKGLFVKELEQAMEKHSINECWATIGEVDDYVWSREPLNTSNRLLARRFFTMAACKQPVA